MVSFEKSWTWLALAQTLGSVNEIYPKLKIKIKIKGQKGEQACEGGTVHSSVISNIQKLH